MGENMMEGEMKSRKELIENQTQAENGKRGYHKPELAVFGDVQELTANTFAWGSEEWFFLDVRTG